MLVLLWRRPSAGIPSSRTVPTGGTDHIPIGGAGALSHKALHPSRSQVCSLGSALICDQHSGIPEICPRPWWLRRVMGGDRLGRLTGEIAPLSVVSRAMVLRPTRKVCDVMRATWVISDSMHPREFRAYFLRWLREILASVLRGNWCCHSSDAIMTKRCLRNSVYLVRSWRGYDNNKFGLLHLNLTVPSNER
jgi:hypothetical protein